MTIIDKLAALARTWLETAVERERKAKYKGPKSDNHTGYAEAMRDANAKLAAVLAEIGEVRVMHAQREAVAVGRAEMVSAELNHARYNADRTYLVIEPKETP